MSIDFTNITATLFISIIFWQLIDFKLHVILSSTVRKNKRKALECAVLDQKVAGQTTKNTEYQMEKETFMFSFFMFFLSFYSFLLRCLHAILF